MQAPNVLDFLDILKTRAKSILVFALLLGVAGYLVSYLIPPTYQAAAVILPPEEDELTSALSLSRPSLTGLNAFARLGDYFTQADVAMAILKSRTVRESVVDSFHLRERYKTKTLEASVRRLDSRTRIRMATNGTISVTVEDGDPRQAADMANAFISQLDVFNRNFRNFRARRTRIFLSRRVAEADSALRSAERQLAVYQKLKGAIVLPAEARGSLDAGTRLMAEKVGAEVDLELLRGYASSQSEEVQRLEARVRELRRRVGDLPSTQVGGAELLRQTAVQQEVFAFLTGQLEQSRIREAMDTPTVQVLDPARAPERRFWPRRSWIALFGAMIGVVLAMANPLQKLPWRA